MLQSQRDFNQACARFLPTKPEPQRKFEDWNQDKLRKAMKDATIAEETQDAKERPRGTIKDAIDRLMHDERWRTSSEIATKLRVSDASVRKILLSFADEGKAWSMCVDRTYCWTFAAKPKRILKRVAVIDPKPWKPSDRQQAILDIMQDGEWYKVCDLAETLNLRSKQVASAMSRLSLNSAVKHRKYKSKGHYEWSKV